jgi:site-specific recombinase XerD
LVEHLTFNQVVLGSNPRRLTLNTNPFVNDFVNSILAMAQAQYDPDKLTQFMTVGGLQLGNPTASQKWLNEFIKSRRQGLSKRTIEFYKDTLSKAIGIDLTPQGINSWLTSLTCDNGKFSHYRAMKAFCNWLYRSKKILKNPISLVDRPKVSKRILPAVTVAQLTTLIASTDNFRDKCILQLLFDSGCRLSEIAGIKDTDYDWVKCRVTVIGKGNKQRNAPFTQNTSVPLQQWFATHKTFELKTSGIQNMLELLGKKAGIECNAHSFRRGFAIHQLKLGFSTRVVQSWGGWESIAMVETYSKQLSQEDALDMYAK